MQPLPPDAAGACAEHSGDLLETSDALWIAWVGAGPDHESTPAPESSRPSATIEPALVRPAAAQAPALETPLAAIHLVRIAHDKTAAASAPALATLAGDTPGLVQCADGAIVVTAILPAEGGMEAAVAYRTDDAGMHWTEPALLVRAARILCGHPVVLPDGTLLVPLVLQDTPDATQGFDVARSTDGGRQWSLNAAAIPVDALAVPSLAALGGGVVVCAARQGARIVRAASSDAGRTWSLFTALEFETAADPVLIADAGQLRLAFTEPRPDTTLAAPALQGLRLAASADAGRTWTRATRLFVHPGRTPMPAALVSLPEGLALLCQERTAQQSVLTCRAWPWGAPRNASKAPSAVDTLATRDALRVLAAHTLGRPKRSRRLFVEAYAMRTLVAAHTALTACGAGKTDWFDSQRGLERAIAYADTLVAIQDKFGFWPLGYPAIWIADMGAAAALFGAVEKYVDEPRLQRYQAAAERFLRGVANEKLLHETGEVGLGRELIVDTVGLPRRMSPEPYLVSTALVGIETRAWLFHRTHKPEYRVQALRSLDYTLSQITAEGFKEPATCREGSLRAAAYIEEGWIAADMLLEDPAVLTKLRRALGPHVDWLLRTQRKDGTWDSKEDGTFGRTPGIINFLLWYDRRCRTRSDVRAAIARASAAFADTDRWHTLGILRANDHHEVQRVLLGRSLAALAGNHWVY